MFTQAKKALGATVLSLLLALSLVLPCIGAQPAYADELSDAQATLDAASKQLDSISNEYNDLQKQIQDLDTEIASTTQKVQDAQTAMLDGQQVLGEAVLAEYKSDGGLSLVNIILSSSNISDLITNMTYYSSIQEDQAELIAEQRQLNETFNAALDDLNAQRDNQQDMLDEASAKKEEAEKVVNDASAKVSSIKESQAALAALQQKASQMDQQQTQQGNQQESSNWNTNNQRPAASGGSQDNGSGNSGGNASSGGSSSGSTSSTKGWRTGAASAYGGSSDPNTPNPGTTATGAVCNDSSMGVAIPMSWPNYRSYYGRAIEISYNGRTVVATINDCGSLGGGARSLDLQPGVFKAFGFSTCQAWGVRTVSYRIL